VNAYHLKIFYQSYVYMYELIHVAGVANSPSLYSPLDD
jgi:hypothetical protein